MSENTLYIILAIGLFFWFPLLTWLFDRLFSALGWKEKGSRQVGSADEYLYEPKDY